MRSNTPSPERQEAVEAAIDTENRLRVFRKEYHGHKVKQYQSFPRQRIGALTRLLQHRHRGSCGTDDGEVWFEIVAPFLVQAARIEHRDPLAEVLAWSHRFIPAFTEEIGTEGIASRVSGIFERRDAARSTRSDWLPKMPEIVATLRITLKEVRACKLKGYGSINPPTAEDRKLQKKERARQDRIAKGMVPQASRTKTKCDDAVAEAIGLKSRRTIQNWRRAKVLDAKLAPLIDSGVVDFTKLCPPSFGIDGAHTFAKAEPATNDNDRLERSA
ncbi:hypothetical protein ASF33_14740 [Methylobacterium sp. Leaf92]|nr:hypothetical protein ASF33_14740 [Methylobacterium sp. Leaf92]